MWQMRVFDTELTLAKLAAKHRIWQIRWFVRNNATMSAQRKTS